MLLLDIDKHTYAMQFTLTACCNLTLRLVCGVDSSHRSMLEMGNGMMYNFALVQNRLFPVLLSMLAGSLQHHSLLHASLSITERKGRDVQ